MPSTSWTGACAHRLSVLLALIVVYAGAPPMSLESRGVNTAKVFNKE
jgi:hypothetical protein